MANAGRAYFGNLLQVFSQKHQPWSGFSAEKIFPPVLKTLSEEELVAGMHRYFLARLGSHG